MMDLLYVEPIILLIFKIMINEPKKKKKCINKGILTDYSIVKDKYLFLDKMREVSGLIYAFVGDLAIVGSADEKIEVDIQIILPISYP